MLSNEGEIRPCGSKLQPTGQSSNCNIIEIPGRRNFLVNEWSGTRIGRSPLPQRFPPRAYPRMLSHLQPFPRIPPLVPPRRHATVKSKVYVTPHGAPHRTRAASEAWSLKSEYSSGAPAGRNLAAWFQDFAIAMSCEDYRTNPILAVTYFTSLIESVS